MACFRYLTLTLFMCGMFDQCFMVNTETRIGLIEHLLHKILNTDFPEIKEKLAALQNRKIGVTESSAIQINENRRGEIKEKLTELASKTNIMLHGFAAEKRRRKYLDNVTDVMRVTIDSLVDKTAELAARVDNQRVFDKSQIIPLVTEAAYELMYEIQDKGKQTQLGLESALQEIEEMSRDIRDIKTSTNQKLQKLTETMGCRDGWVRIMDSCIFFSDEPKSWMDARSHCKYIDSDLAEPYTREAVQSLRHPLTDNIVWLGANDKHEEGRWIWESTGQEIDDNLWSDGEPNNGGQSGNEEDCLEFNYPNYFNDRKCNQAYHYVCEIKL